MNKIIGVIKGTRIHPDLEELIVTPSKEEQNFESTKDGYSNVKVNAMECETLNVTPSGEEQTFTGLYDEVNVSKINVEEKTATLDFSQSDVVNVTPTEGNYIDKVVINKDSNLVAENIKKDVTIFGVSGTTTVIDTNDATATAEDIMEGKTAYVKEEKIVGTMKASENNVLIESPESTSFDISKLIAEIDFKNIDTSNVTNFGNTFSNCDNLLQIKNLTSLNTSKATYMANMFYNCKKLEKIDLSNFNTSSVYNMGMMFYGCSSLTSLDLSSFDTSNVTAMNQIFYGCSSLTEILGELDASKVTNIQTSNANNTVLENFKGYKNLGKAYTQKTANSNSYTLSLNASNNLTHDSLMNIINNLYDLNLSYDVANAGTLYAQTLQLGATNLAKLTAEEIAIATSKGWNVT